MALFSRDKDNKKAAREAIREGRQETRQAGRQARDESLAAGETRTQARAKKRLAKRKGKESLEDEMKLMEQLRQMYPGNIIRKTPGGSAGGFDIDAPPPVPLRKMERAAPSPGELGVTQEEADIGNPPHPIYREDTLEEQRKANDFWGETGLGDQERVAEDLLYWDQYPPSSDMTPEQIAEMEAEVARTDQIPTQRRRIEEKRRK